MNDDLDIEPDTEPQVRQSTRDAFDAVGQPMDGGDDDKLVTLAKFLPEGFPLLTLLRFLPDVKLKQHAVECAQRARAIDVTTPTGLADGEVALEAVRASVHTIESAFNDPVSLANQLHKRLTGLRADFCDDANAAATALSKRLYAEKQCRDAVVELERRRVQAAADEQARKDAAQLAKDAASRQAPPHVVSMLQEQAKTMTAPPVSTSIAAPSLGRSTAIERWKARLKTTASGAEPNPAMADLTPSQRLEAEKFFDAVSHREVPIVCAAIDWPELNRKANAERKTFAVPGMEAFDDGSLRGKGKR